MPVRATTGARETPSADPGFSLVEVVIAMFVLMMMSLFFLPVLIGAMSTNVTNREIVSATSFANALLTDARREGGFGCTSLNAWVANPTPADASFEVTVAKPVATFSCPSSLPDTITVEVTVHPKGETGKTLITLSTKVMVESP